MALENWYSAGTVSVESGSTTVTLSGGFWGGDAIMAGDFLVIPSISSDQIAVGSVTSPTELELLWAWPHADAEDVPYFIFYTGIIERSTAQTRKVLEQLGDVKAWYDVIVEDDDARLALDTEGNPLRAGYRVLVRDDGVIWAKKTSAYGDWIGPVEFKGDKGNKGWSPHLVAEADGARRVLKLSGYVGGEGDPPTANVGQYLKADGTWTSTIGDAVDFRGEGFVFVPGEYDDEYAYGTGNVARSNGSAWITLQPTIGNSPPVYPTTSNDYWELLAVKGQDGTGTGDVVGPNGATDGAFAAADGATGKKVKFLTATQATASLNAVVGDGGSGGTKGLVPAPAAGDTAAKKFLRADGTWAPLSLEELELTVSQLTLGLADALNIAQFLGPAGNRVADSFDALTYVDVAGAANLNTGTPGILKATAIGGGLISGATGTNIGNMTSSGGLAAAFNGSASVFASSATIANSTSGYAGKNYSAAPKKIASARFYASTDAGFDGTAGASNYTLRLYGKNGNAPSSDTDGTLLGSATGVDPTGTNSLSVVITSSDQATSWDYVWGYISTDAPASSGRAISELEITEASSVTNLTVRSTAFTAASVPSKMKGLINVKEIDAAVAGIDYTLECSRDGGTTWATMMLSERYTLPTTGLRVVEAAETDVSAQPSGSAPRWRFKTLNNKNVELHDVYLYWS